MRWEETSGLEKDITLSLQNKSKGISEMANELERNRGTIGKIVERMMTQNLVSKTHDYSKDAKKVLVSINKERVRIKKVDWFYLKYFLTALFSFILSVFLTIYKKNPYFLFGCLVGIIPSVFYMAYMVYIEKDKIIVEKLVKGKKELKKI